MELRKSYVVAGAMLFGCFLAVGTARAARFNLARGTYSITAHGGGADTIQSFDDGHMDVAGFAVLNGKGGAASLNLTVAYQDDDEDYDGPTCLLTDPKDLSYSYSRTTGVGTMTLTVGSGDKCYPGNEFGNSADIVDEAGNSIIFTLYVGPNQARLVSTSSDFEATDYSSTSEVIFAPTMAGEAKRLTPSPRYGQMVLSGTGQTIDSDGDFGHESLAGSIDLNRKGGASSLDVTLVYSDNSEPQDAETCHLTDPADVAYSFSGNVGTLKLTIGPNDSCYSTLKGPGSPVNNSGSYLTFNLYKGNQGLVTVSTNSDFLDGNGNLVDDPGILGSLAR